MTDAMWQLSAYDVFHALRIGSCGAAASGHNKSGVKVVDLEESPEQQYEQTGSSTMSHILLFVLVAVVCFIGGLAAWTSA